MQGFDAGTVVRVPFPYTDRQTSQRRPALVVSRGGVGDGGRLLWVVMVTSAENRRWPGDVDVVDHADAGLPAPSIVRTSKIATIEAGHAEAIGRAPADLWARVRAELAASLG